MSMTDRMCPDCAGLGATVEVYPVKDDEGYEYMAQKQVECATCGGTGRVR